MRSPRGMTARGFAEWPSDVKDVIVPEGVELTFMPYNDVPELGFDRGRDFCLMTLRHPSFLASAEQRRELYAQKRAHREKRIQSVFERCDIDGSGTLDSTQLRSAMELIGMPAADAVVHGLLFRHARREQTRIHPDEFSNVVAEVWGRFPDATFCDQLEAVDSSLTGSLAVSFIGRQSPAGWVLRLVRNAWPYALKRVTILRNTGDNPALDPSLMETLIDTYEGQVVGGLNTALELAHMAVQQPPTSKGGIAVRFVATPHGAEAWPEGGHSTVVPFRGLPENVSPGLFGRLRSWGLGR